MGKANLDNWRLSFVERRTLLVLGDFVVSLVALGVSLISWATISDEWLGFSLAFFQLIFLKIFFF